MKEVGGEKVAKSGWSSERMGEQLGRVREGELKARRVEVAAIRRVRERRQRAAGNAGNTRIAPTRFGRHFRNTVKPHHHQLLASFFTLAPWARRPSYRTAVATFVIYDWRYNQRRLGRCSTRRGLDE